MGRESDVAAANIPTGDEYNVPFHVEVCSNCLAICLYIERLRTFSTRKQKPGPELCHWRVNTDQLPVLWTNIKKYIYTFINLHSVYALVERTHCTRPAVKKV